MTDPARIFVLGSFVNACCADVAVLPRPGESLLADRFSSEPGGKGFNVAAGARRLGAMVDCLAAIGDDLFGQLAEQAFTAAGLATHLLRRYPTQTGAGIGFISANGENCVAVYPGANLSVSAEDARAAALNIAAALAVGLAGGMPLPDSLRRAAAAGALMASRRRTFGAFPAIADVDELLRGGQTHADETIT